MLFSEKYYTWFQTIHQLYYRLGYYHVFGIIPLLCRSLYTNLNPSQLHLLLNLYAVFKPITYNLLKYKGLFNINIFITH